MITYNLVHCKCHIDGLYGCLVEDWETEMGGQVSSSNHIVADQISITTDREVLFTVERAVGR